MAAAFTRTYNIYDSVQIHTAFAAKDELNFFNIPVGSQANQITTGTNTPYNKTSYHTNSKVNTTESNQKLVVKGFELWLDEVDAQLVTDVFLSSKSYFEFFVGDDRQFIFPLAKMVNLGGITATIGTDAQSAAKAQKLGIILPSLEMFELKPWGIVVGPQTTFRAKITVGAAVTFKKFTFDYNTLAANAAYTTAFNMFLSLRTEETRS